MSQSPASSTHHPLRWLSAVALLGLLPKCVVCLAAYLGIGTLLGFRISSPELCGGSTTTGFSVWSVWIAALVITVAAIAFSYKAGRRTSKR